MFPDAIPHASPQELQSNSFKTSHRVVLLNGDTCVVGNWVLVRHPHSDSPRVCQIAEILQRVGHENDRLSRPDVILLQQGSISGFVEPYRMPGISVSNQWMLIPLQVSIYYMRSPPFTSISFVGYNLRCQHPAPMSTLWL